MTEFHKHENIEEMERCGPICAWSAELLLSESELRRKLAKVIAIPAISEQNRIIGCYPESVVRQCVEEDKQLIIASENGFAYLNGNRYATKLKWSKELPIPLTYLDKQLQGVQGVEGKDTIGNRRIFFEENVVREKCARLLAPSEFFTENGEIYYIWENGVKEPYATQEQLAKELTTEGLQVSRNVVIRVLKIHKCKSVLLRSRRGPPRDFYSVNEIKFHCQNYLAFSKGEKEVTFDGRISTTASAFSEMNGIPLSVVWKTITRQKINKLSFTAVNAYWKDDLERLFLKLDENGITFIEGKPAIAIEAYAKSKGMGPFTMRKKIQAAKIEEIQGALGRGQTNIPHKVYWQSEVDAIIPLNADSRGIVIIKGKEAVILNPYAEFRGLKSPQTLQKYVRDANINPIPEISVSARGKPSVAYWKIDIDPLIPKKLSQSGVIDINGRKAVGINAYATTHKIPYDTLVKRIEEAGLKPVDIKVLGGCKTIEIFWEDEIRHAVPRKLEQDGTVIIDGIQYVAISAYAKANSMTPLTLKKWTSKLTPLPDVRVMYPPHKVEVYFKDDVDKVIELMTKKKQERPSKIVNRGNSDIPCASQDGFITKNEELYGTLSALARELGISVPAIKARIRGMQGETFRMHNGRTLAKGFYSEREVREKCHDLLLDLPCADTSGFFRLGSESEIRYGTIKSWAHEMGTVSEASMRRRLKSVKGITGKDKGGRIDTDGFYTQEEINIACADLLSEMPCADETNFFVLDAERFGTVHAWSNELKITSISIRKRLKHAKGMTAKDSQKKIVWHGFFSESLIKEICRDILERVSIPNLDQISAANPIPIDKFIILGNTKYGTIDAWANKLNISISTINRRLRGINGIKGRLPNGRMIRGCFFAEEIVRRQCAELLDPNIPIADETGFFTMNGERYGTANLWAKFFNLPTTLYKKLKAANGQKGKDSFGRIWTFYSESIVRKHCNI